MPLASGALLGPYRIESSLGVGGMGEVYRARDMRLDRPVAIKVLPGHVASDPLRKQRFEREARAIAGLNHPHICTLHDVGSQDGIDFLVMECLDGETLEARLAGGPLPIREAIQMTLVVLSTLTAVHRQGLLHRDLKPSNLFMTPHGLKLLDFGLARPVIAEPSATTDVLTHAGTVLGTPPYLSPESLQGQPVDVRSDVYAVGAVLYTMLTGQPPFRADSIAALIQAVVRERPPALTGSPAIAAVDRVIHRAMAKRPENRYPSAEAMSQELREVMAQTGDSAETPMARPVTRLIVLPFRVLRPDPETDFLGFSLPDAIAGSLSGLDSLVVRSSIIGAKFSVEAPDLDEIATQADVDVVLVGTLLRAGEDLRVSLQLLEAPGGTVVWSHQTRVALGDLFQLQDDVAQRIVQSLSSPLMAQELSESRRDSPATALTYEFFLRGNQLSAKGHLSRPDATEWQLARDFYRRCVLEDPDFAPAWAQLGRVYWLTEKYFPNEAEDSLTAAEAALTRALAINPDLALAHKIYAYVEVDQGRAPEAMLRLLEQTRRRSADPELFAGLVHACRYCGLLDASLAAHEHARRLDGKVPTSIVNTHWHLGDYEWVAATPLELNPMTVGLAWMKLDRADHARRGLQALQATTSRMRHFFAAVLAAIEGDRDRTVAAVERATDDFRDPEGLCYGTLLCACVDAVEPAVQLFERVVSGGFSCFPSFARDTWLDALRADARFERTLSLARARHRAAVEAFLTAGGDRVLGIGRP